MTPELFQQANKISKQIDACVKLMNAKGFQNMIILLDDQQYQDDLDDLLPSIYQEMEMHLRSKLGLMVRNLEKDFENL